MMSRIPPEDRCDVLAVLSELRARAFAPDSRFLAAAVVETARGERYGGVNWETPHRTQGCCAETSAIVSAVSQGGPVEIDALWFSGANHALDDAHRVHHPCGSCLQLLGELASADCMVHCASLRGDVVHSRPLSEHLPHPFVFRSYIPGAVGRGAGGEASGTFEPSDGDDVCARLRVALARGFCPDGSRREGVVVRTRDGSTFTGSSVAAANYRCSVSACAAAISSLVSTRGAVELEQAWFWSTDGRPAAITPPGLPSVWDLQLLSIFGCEVVSVVEPRVTQPPAPLPFVRYSLPALAQVAAVPSLRALRTRVEEAGGC